MSWWRREPAAVSEPEPWSAVLEARVRKRVIVTLKSRDAFGGVLVEADDRAWVLREASAIGAGEHRTNLVVDGEVVLLVGEIAYVQMP